MKTSLKDLNGYLFEELERLNDDESLDGDGFERELKRAKSITSVSMAIINNARTILEAKRTADYMGVNDNEILMIGTANEEMD